MSSCFECDPKNRIACPFVFYHIYHSPTCIHALLYIFAWANVRMCIWSIKHLPIAFMKYLRRSRSFWSGSAEMLSMWHFVELGWSTDGGSRVPKPSDRGSKLNIDFLLRNDPLCDRTLQSTVFSRYAQHPHTDSVWDVHIYKTSSRCRDHACLCRLLTCVYVGYFYIGSLPPSIARHDSGNIL